MATDPDSEHTDITVLHVDDDPNDQEITRFQLKRISPELTLRFADNGEEALEIIEQEDVDLVLSDYQMPGMSGMELLHRLRNDGNTIPFIFLTGQGSENVAVEALRSGADDYFTKDEGFAHYDRLWNRILHAIHAHDNIVGRQKAERRIARERDRAQAYLNVADVIIVALNPDGSVRMINNTGLELLGYREEELLGHNWFDTVLPDTLIAQFKEFFEDLMSGTLEPHRTTEHEVLTKSGDSLLFSWRNTLVRDEGGSIIYSLSSGTDVTEKRKTEDRIREEQARYRALFESSSEGLIIYDAETYQILEVNRKACEMYRYSEEEFLKLTVPDVSLEWEDSQRVIDQANSKGSASVSARAQRRGDGDILYVSASVFTLSIRDRKLMCASVRDITDKITSQRELLIKTLALDAAPCAIAVTDTNGILKYVNEALLIMWGYRSKEDMVGTSAVEHWADQENAQSYFETLLEEGFLREHLIAQRNDGTTFLARGTHSVYPSDETGESLIITVLEDITRATEVAKELQLKERTYRALFEGSPDAVFRLDLDGNLIEVNQIAADLLGYTRDELVGMNYRKIVHPDWLDDSHERLNNMRNGEIYPSYEKVFLRKDGTTVPVEISAKLIRGETGGQDFLLFVVRDISQRKEMEESLSNQQAFLSRAGELGRVGGWEYYPFTGQFRVSPEWQKLMGFSSLIPDDDEILSSLLPEDFDRIREKMKIAAEKKTKFEMIHRARNLQTGKRLWVQDIGEFRPDNKGRARVIGATRDITLEKETEEELQRNTAMLEAANADLKSFAYTLSHDMQAPVRHIRELTSLLKTTDGNNLSEQGTNFIERILERGERLWQLIQDILKLSRVNTHVFQREEVDITALSNTVISMLQQKEEHSFTYELQNNMRASADKGLVHILLENLISNAVKFSSQAGKPHIEVGMERIDEVDTFFVKDNGIGIPEDQMEHLFKPFSRLPDAQEFDGAGVGLATCKRIVQVHQGTIRVASEPGKGTTFHFSLTP